MHFILQCSTSNKNRLVQIGNKTKENDTEKILALTLKLPLFVLQFEQNKFMLRSINKSASKHSIRGGKHEKNNCINYYLNNAAYFYSIC